MVKRELATVKQHIEETSVQLEQAQSTIRHLQQPFAVRTVQRQRHLDEKPFFEHRNLMRNDLLPHVSRLQLELYLKLSMLLSNKISATSELHMAALVMMLFTCMTADQNSRAEVICVHKYAKWGLCICQV